MRPPTLSLTRARAHTHTHVQIPIFLYASVARVYLYICEELWLRAHASKVGGISLFSAAAHRWKVPRRPTTGVGGTERRRRTRTRPRGHGRLGRTRALI